MSRKQSNPTAETLRELEATGDRVAEWASENAALILGVIAGVLVIAAGIGFYVQHGSTARDEAANALALTSAQYRQAMGADPSGGPIPEPANPAIAERTRTDFAERFGLVAREHTGTTAGGVAWLEAGSLQLELGRVDEATRSFEAAREQAPDSAIAALASTRLAALAEDRGDPAAAAAEYETAAAVESYPLRAAALADAARTWADAGEDARALAAFQRLESEFPDQTPAPHVAARIAELRMRSEP